ncbi:hypothetical protein [Carboxylicivirga sp. RSCT41]|uniref:hypothetical protein n=1 Tax=Carboxylicivirga agarovorans TaxID=3417570 RepID=UPI003D3491B5
MKKLAFILLAFIAISSALYLVSFQVNHCIDVYRLQSETNEIDKVSQSLSALNRSMGKLEEKPQKENFIKVKSNLDKFMISDLSQYEPWFPEKKNTLLDSIKLLFKPLETSDDLDKAISTIEFIKLRAKLLETEVYYSKLLQFNIDKSITNLKYEILVQKGRKRLNLLSGILFSLGILALYLGIRISKTTRTKKLP